MSRQYEVGSEFEKLVVTELRKNGFWAVLVPKSITGQPFDIFGAKDNVAYAIECKHADSDRLAFSRAENNQRIAMLAFLLCNNQETWYACQCPMGIYMHHAGNVAKAIENGQKSVKITEGIEWQEWIRQSAHRS